MKKKKPPSTNPRPATRRTTQRSATTKPPTLPMMTPAPASCEFCGEPCVEAGTLCLACAEMDAYLRYAAPVALTLDDSVPLPPAEDSVENPIPEPVRSTTSTDVNTVTTPQVAKGWSRSALLRRWLRDQQKRNGAATDEQIDAIGALARGAFHDARVALGECS